MSVNVEVLNLSELDPLTDIIVLNVFVRTGTLEELREKEKAVRATYGPLLKERGFDYVVQFVDRLMLECGFKAFSVINTDELDIKSIEPNNESEAPDITREAINAVAGE